jgi:adenylate kinase family enzyme
MKTLAAKEPKHHIVSGFPGIGKSTFAEKYGNKVSDSDSSKFDKAEFPTNYMRHIVEQAKTKDWVMVSSHDVVRKALVELGLPFTLVYPYKELKQEYLQRYADRGSPKAFIDMMDEKWDQFVTECYSQTGCTHIVLTSGQFLADVL